MAFKRLIALLPVQAGQVVMSYGYKRHKPAGSLGTVLRNLDRWGIDEIAVIDISRGLNEPNSSILEQIRLSAVRTPVAFGGGIRSVRHAVTAVAQGCDRVIVETLIWKAPQEINRIAEAIGQQAVIGAVPMVYRSDGLTVAPVNSAGGETWGNYLKRVEGIAISELMVIDRENEGAPGNSELSKHMPVTETLHKLIWFGGLSASQAAALLERPDTTGVAFGNPFLVKELAVNEHRRDINVKMGSQHLRKVRPNEG
jgi:cyclase